MKARAAEHRLEAAMYQVQTHCNLVEELEDEMLEVEFTARVDAMKYRRHHEAEAA